MSIRIRRRLDSGPLEPREYRIREGAMGSRFIWLACPHCGLEQRLDNPRLRWFCESENCPAADYLHLEDE